MKMHPRSAYCLGFIVLTLFCPQSRSASDIATAPDSSVNAPAGGNASTKWNDLTAIVPTQVAALISGNADWATIATLADTFLALYPNDSHGRLAAKYRAIANVRREDSANSISSSTQSIVDAYLTDTGNPSRDRCETTMVYELGKLRRQNFAGLDERNVAHAAYARKLIRDFPAEMEGYGYLLSLSKIELADNARSMAQELLGLPNTPAAFRAGAQRLLGRFDMVGKQFRLDGAEDDIAAARGRPLIVYTWTYANDGVLPVVKRLAQSSDFRFIGINLDPDVDVAKGLTAKIQPPGLQYFDGGGLDGPKAQQLNISIPSSLYLIDGNGIIVTTNGSRDIDASLEVLMSKGGK